MKMNFKIPGKVMLNGGYIVLKDEFCIAVTLKEYFHVFCEINSGLGRINFQKNNLNYQFEYINSKWISCDKHNDTYFLINLLYATEFPEGYNILIKGIFDKGFFTNNNEKTGIGSSSCILIAFSYLSYTVKNNFGEFNHSLFHEYCMEIHKKTFSNSSGYDTTACILGSIIYSINKWKKYFTSSKYLILASFNSSTSSREMIKKICINEEWNNLININRQIISGRNLYENYLEELRKISNEIVPDKHYYIMKELFKRFKCPCGVSGAGGEDAFWILTNDPLEIIDYLKTNVDFYKICETSNEGLQIEKNP